MLLKFPSSPRYADRPTTRIFSAQRNFSKRVAQFFRNVKCGRCRVCLTVREMGMRHDLTYSLSAFSPAYSSATGTHDCCAVYTYTPRTTRLPFFRHYLVFAMHTVQDLHDWPPPYQKFPRPLNCGDRGSRQPASFTLSQQETPCHSRRQ